MAYHKPFNAPQWIKVTKTFSDFSTAALTNSINLYLLSAKQMVHSVQLVPSIAFSGGLVATYTISVGISGTNAKYAIATNVFTGATIPPINLLGGLESVSSAVQLTATAISTVANLNAATQGSADIYLLISTLP